MRSALVEYYKAAKTGEIHQNIHFVTYAHLRRYHCFIAYIRASTTDISIHVMQCFCQAAKLRGYLNL